MSEMEQNDHKNEDKKKIGLEEAIKQKLASKKQQHSPEKTNTNLVKSTKKLKSQQTKKVNNQRKRTGV